MGIIAGRSILIEYLGIIFKIIAEKVHSKFNRGRYCRIRKIRHGDW